MRTHVSGGLGIARLVPGHSERTNARFVGKRPAVFNTWVEFARCFAIEDGIGSRAANLIPPNADQPGPTSFETSKPTTL